jgi:hypothetical protein
MNRSIRDIACFFFGISLGRSLDYPYSEVLVIVSGMVLAYYAWKELQKIREENPDENSQ